MKKIYTNLKTNINSSFVDLKIFVRKETFETKEMTIVFKQVIKYKISKKHLPPSKEEIDKALKQLSDIGKISILTPLVLLPGSVITIPILVKVLKKYNINILPS
jgi:hypothetical protein